MFNMKCFLIKIDLPFLLIYHQVREQYEMESIVLSYERKPILKTPLFDLN